MNACHNKRAPTGLRVPARAVRGLILLDGLIAILIFSLGILGMVALQSVSVKFSTDAKFRTDAAMFADQLLAQMWGAAKSPTTPVSTAFASPGGSAFTAWQSGVLADLPGVAANPPTVVFNGTQVTVTVNWRAPNDSGPHNYVSVSQICDVPPC